MKRLALMLVLLLSSASAQAREFTFNEKIVGIVQKPEIEILISRQNLTPKYVLVLKESFLPKIVESIKNKPF